MSSYRRGRRAENYIRGILKTKGAELVIRSSRSLTFSDLVAFFPKKREIWLIQVKAKKGEKIPEGYEEAKRFEGDYKVRFMFAIRGKSGWMFKMPSWELEELKRMYGG